MMNKLLTTLSLMLAVLIGSTGCQTIGSIVTDDIIKTQKSAMISSRKIEFSNNLSRVKKSKMCPDCFLKSALLEGMDLSQAFLPRANLQMANLKKSNLMGANLEGVNFRGANLENAYIRYANLTNANLNGANLKNADLRGANFSRYDAQFKGANLADAKLDPEGVRIARASGAINIPEATVVAEKKSTPVSTNTSYAAHEPTKSVSESADARIKRLEAEAKRLKIQKLEQEIARLRGDTATPSASVQQRPSPVKRTPVNTRRHFADDYSCGSNDISCWQNFVLQNPASKRAIKGGSDMTETQFFLTSKILFSSLNSKKLANKRGMLALYDGLLESAKSYEGGRISKKQYLEIGKKLQAEGDKFNEEQEAFRNRTNWKRGFFAFTRALQGHLQRQERNYQEQMKEMNRNQRNEPPRYNCTTGSRVYGSGKNSYLMTNCNPLP